MFTSAMFSIEKCQDVKVTVETPSSGTLNIFRIQADGQSLNLFCSDEQLDQIAAAIHKERKLGPTREEIVQLIEDMNRVALGCHPDAHGLASGIGQVLAELKDLIGYDEEARA